MGLADTVKSLGVSSGGSSLKGFLTKFNSSEGLYVNTIDTLHTFDVQMYFYPSKGEAGEKELLDRIGDAAMSALKNLGNNVTGGLLGAVMNTNKMKVVDSKAYDPQKTFISYLAEGNCLEDIGDDNQVVLDLSYYVQNMQIPQINMKEDGQMETMVGTFPVNGKVVNPTQNTFTMDIINTKASVVERIFYPWMREVTLPFWSYETRPYTTADIHINFEKHADLSYMMVGCRPSQIETLRPSNELATPTRTVTMMFDYMFVYSKLEKSQSLGDALLDVGKSALGGVANTLGL